MSFSSDIKEELSKVNNLKNKTILEAEFLGYILTGNTTNSRDVLEFITENEFNIERFYRILFNLGIEYEPEVRGKVFVATIKKTDKLKEVMRFIGGISGNDNIWQDIFDRNKGAWLRCFAKFNNEDVIIEGTVKYYEPCEDGECSIALVNYSVKYPNGNVYKLGKRNDEPVMYINTRNIHGLEVTKGK